MFIFKKFKIGICLLLILAIPQNIILAKSIETEFNSNQLIISSPIDSRPISTDYLENLVDLGGDSLYVTPQNLLDFYSSDPNISFVTGNSQLIRDDIYNQVSLNNSNHTSVIINTSSYFTGGLVSSRHINQYTNYMLAISDLRKLLYDFDNPTYYIHANMPRNLPESRGQNIWPTQNKEFGLAHFYIKNNPYLNPQILNNIQSNFEKVSPEQLLLEWGYVETKKYELGENGLSKWEKEFLNYFYNTFMFNPLYKDYVSNYKQLFQKSSEMIKELLSLSYLGLIDELIISTDDYQLPQFILHLTKQDQLNSSWIQKDYNQQVIKFSFSKLYLESHQNSIYSYHKKLFGQASFLNSHNGLGTNINYIFGTDEIPQMIYARDLSKRKEISSNFLEPVFDYNINKEQALYNTSDYDVLNTKKLIDQRINFVTNKSVNGFYNNVKIPNDIRPIKIYVNKYTEKFYDLDKKTMKFMIQDMFDSYNSGYNVGLIELYKPIPNIESINPIFDLLTDPYFLTELGYKNNGINQLITYSSWNTDGNAIGLGIAHAQVFGISEALASSLGNNEEIARKQIQVLGQHIVEDGIYGAKLKNNVKYQINSQHLLYNAALFNDITKFNPFFYFTNPITPMRVGENRYSFKQIYLSQICFPWLRMYEIKLKLDIY